MATSPHVGAPEELADPTMGLHAGCRSCLPTDLEDPMGRTVSPTTLGTYGAGTGAGYFCIPASRKDVEPTLIYEQ